MKKKDVEKLPNFLNLHKNFYLQYPSQEYIFMYVHIIVAVVTSA